MENLNNEYSVKVQPRQVVKCPKCSYEYLPGEILFPDQVLGKPSLSSIIRDPLGHILYEEYDEQPLAEDTFTCYNCNTPFKINIELKLKASDVNTELNFNDDQVALW